MHKVHFELTEDHLKLIREMNISYEDYCEFGAPAVNPKRPYGNSDVYHDIGKILGIDPLDGDEEEKWFTEPQQKDMLTMHKETTTALQVVLAAGSFEIGTYESDQYRDNWQKV